jgi:enoyl-CoA hydratase
VSTKHIHIEELDNVTVVKLDRPPANALDLSFTQELEAALGDTEIGGTGSLVLTGTGDFFSAGLDLKLVPGYSQDEQREMILALGRLVGRLYADPRPTVAAVNGHAVAAGTLLALACDYRVGPRGDYRYGLTGARVGIPYPVAAQTVIESELDPATRRILVLGATQLGPEEAVHRGILDELYPADRVLARAVDVARERATLPADAYGKIKRQLRATALQRIRDANEGGNDPFLESWITADSASASAEALASVWLGPRRNHFRRVSGVAHDRVSAGVLTHTDPDRAVGGHRLPLPEEVLREPTVRPRERFSLVLASAMSPINALTGSGYDPITDTAELKVCVVNVQPKR